MIVTAHPILWQLWMLLMINQNLTTPQCNEYVFIHSDYWHEHTWHRD